MGRASPGKDFGIFFTFLNRILSSGDCYKTLFDIFKFKFVFMQNYKIFIIITAITLSLPKLSVSSTL